MLLVAPVSNSRVSGVSPVISSNWIRLLITEIGNSTMGAGLYFAFSLAEADNRGEVANKGAEDSKTTIQTALTI